MAGLDKVKIRKKVYQFEFKRRYDYTKHFRKLERPPIERIKDVIKELTAPKKEEKKKAVAITGPPPGGFNFMVFGAALLVGIILLSLAYLYIVTQVEAPTGLIEPQPEKPMMENTIMDGMLLSSGERGSPLSAAAVRVDYDTRNLDNYTVSLTPYQVHLPSEIFILESERIEATDYGEFLAALRSNLSSRNLVLNEISISELETMPDGAVVIVPSGVIPKELIGIDSTLDMNKLADRGIVVVYIGRPFTEYLNGTSTTFTPQEILRKLPVTFDTSTPLSSTLGFNLYQPLYRVSAGAWKSDLSYGSVSIITKGDGAFVFLPQTLNGGWRGDSVAAASDISRIIFETPWADPIAETNTYGFANQTQYSGSRYFFSNPFNSDRSSVKVNFLGYSNTSNFPIRETLYIYLENQGENGLFIEDGTKVVPTNITGEYVRINAILKEESAAQPDMFLTITDSNGSQVDLYPQGPVNVQGSPSFDIPIYVDRGEYVISLIDGFGNTYATSYMKVVSIDITYTGFSENRHSVYNFDVSMDGTPVTLSDVTVKVDGGQYGTYNFKNVNRISVDVGSRTGNENLPLGDHTFEFVSGELTVSVPITHKARQVFFTDPLFLGIVILTGGIVVLGLMFARQEHIYYSVDIPDFPPVTRTRIPLSPDVVLSLFEKINENYHWSRTPLNTSEIKNGFKEVFYKGRPIFITDYNVEFLLDQLVKKGKVKESMGYYGLVEWEKKHTIAYLSLMRALRDICVNNAIPFTGLGESKEADSVITVVGQQMSIHFFDKNRDMQQMFDNILKSIGKGITIILFRNNAEKEQFISMLDSSPSVAPLILKMESDSKSLLFHTTDELVNMIVDFKTM